MTSFDTIEDLALITIRDYRIDKLFEIDEDEFKMYLDGFLISAAPKFNECLQSLDFDADAREFSATLTFQEQSILADYMAIEWFTSQVQDVRQFQLHLTSSDFKQASEAQNLKEKSEYLDRLREKVKQECTDYYLANLSKFEGWA